MNQQTKGEPRSPVPAAVSMDETPPVRLSGRLLLAAAIVWIAFAFIVYAMTLRRQGFAGLRQVRDFTFLFQFFDWQVLGFLALSLGPVLLGIRRGRGALIAGGLVASTAALLGFSREWAMPLHFLGFVVWTLASIQTLRIGIRRWIGAEADGWGIGAAALIAFWIAVAFALGLLKILTLGSVVPICVALAVPGLISAAKNWRSGLCKILSFFDRLEPFGIVCLSAIWFMLALTFAWACTPETGSDSMRQYLGVIQFIAERHALEPQYVDWGRLMPKTMQAALVPAYLIGEYVLVKWYAWFSVVALTILMIEEVHRRGGRAGLALFGGVALLSFPLLLQLATWVYMDHFMALLCFAGFALMFRGAECKNQRVLYFAAALMACLGQIKYNGVIFCIVWTGALGIVLWRRDGWKGAIRRGWPVVLLLGLAGSPSYIYTYAVTGNPVYPFMNKIFNSPYWSNSFSSDFGLGSFRVGTGLSAWLLLPWKVTVDSHLIGEMPDGFMGLWMLALFPLPFLNIRRLSRAGAGLGLAGIAMFIGISRTTEYARYWLPALPLMLVPAIVSLGQLIDGGLRVRMPRVSALLALPLLGALLLPASFWASRDHPYAWDAYVKSVSMPMEKYLATVYPGYPMIESINSWIGADDGVLCTGYDPVYTIHARAHEFPFWHANIRGLKDRPDLERFLKEHRIRYWLVNRSSRDEQSYFQDRFQMNDWAWTNARLIAARGALELYDVSPNLPAPKLKILESREVAPKLYPLTKQLDLDGGWQDSEAAQPLPDTQGEGFIQANAGHNLNHVFSVGGGARECRIAIFMAGPQEGHFGLILAIVWYDSEGKQIGQESSGLVADHAFKGYPTPIASPVPPGAAYGKLTLNPWNSLPLQVLETKIDFLGPG